MADLVTDKKGGIISGYNPFPDPTVCRLLRQTA